MPTGPAGSPSNTAPVGDPGATAFTPEQLAGLPHDNAGPKLTALIWAMNLAAVVFIALRFYCKTSRGKGLWWDDYILLASWVCLTAHAAALTYCVSLGYGLHVWDFPFENFPRFVLAVNAAGTLLLVCAAWSKTSFAFTMLRFTTGWTKAGVWFMLISMNIAIGLSALFNWVQCTPIRRVWDPTIPGACWPIDIIIHYDIFSGAYSAALDIILAILPWPLIWKLQMMKREKFGVAVAMSMGFIAGIVAIVKTVQIPRLFSHDMYENVDLFIWGNVECSASMIGASIPFLRVLVRDAQSSVRRRYYAPSSFAARHTQSRSHGGAEAARTGWERRIWARDNDSDRSILPTVPPAGQIVQKSEVVVGYSRWSKYGAADKHELQDL